MVTVQRLYKRHPVKWVTASPLWDTYLNKEQKEEHASAQPDALAPVKFRQPAILRFTSDTFMEDFLKVATTTPERLHYWRVQPETWRIPAPTPLMELPPDDHGESDAAFEDKVAGKDLTLEQKDTLDQLGLVKLYQPANQRFYLVTASLVCRIPGLPDRMLSLGRGEKVFFVIRRLIKSQDSQGSFYDGEYAFVDDTWHFVGNTKEQAEVERLYPAEQPYPMFPVTYYAEADEHKRRMFAGLVPVSNREKFVTSEIKLKPESTTSPDSDSVSITQDQASRVDQLMTVLDMDVFQPWDALLQQYKLCKGMISESLDKIYKSNNSNDQRITQLEDLQKALIKQRDVFQVASLYILLDLASFLKTYLSSVWKVVIREANESTLGEDNKNHPARQLFEALKKAVFESGTDNFSVRTSEGEPPKKSPQLEESYYKIIEGNPDPENKISLVEILEELNQPSVRNHLETNTAPYKSEASDCPSKFLLCGAKLQIKNSQEQIKNSQEEHLLDQLRDTYVREKAPSTGEPLPGIIKEKKAGLLRQALTETLLTSPSHRIPLIPLSQKISQSDIEQATKHPDQDNNRFLIRCVFECPNCPPSLRQVVSEPTLEFQMASYFDPDAPARPIRIPLPVDTTPAGLRKFTKNAMFAISDSLACQIELARKLTLGDLVLSVLPWPFHKDLPDPSSGTCKEKGIDIGKLCTLSIPIITICALILLIIMVLVLDYIFKWVPYLIFCLPLPGLKAKKKEGTP